MRLLLLSVEQRDGRGTRHQNATAQEKSAIWDQQIDRSHAKMLNNHPGAPGSFGSMETLFVQNYFGC
jgi:hypothetical protein